YCCCDSFSGYDTSLDVAVVAPGCRPTGNLLMGSADSCDRGCGADNVPPPWMADFPNSGRAYLDGRLGHHGLLSPCPRPPCAAAASGRPRSSHLFCHVQRIGRAVLLDREPPSASRYGRYCCRYLQPPGRGVLVGPSPVVMAGGACGSRALLSRSPWSVLPRLDCSADTAASHFFFRRFRIWP